MEAFTLIELMATMSLLAILGVLVAQMVTMTNNAVRISTRKANAAAQARNAYQRLERDLDQLLIRDDVDLHMGNPVGSTKKSEILKFFSMVKSAAATKADERNNRGLSLIGYKVDVHPNSNGLPCLQRGAFPIIWDDVGFMGIKEDGSPVPFSESPDVSLESDDYDILAEGVFRIWVSFQLSPQGADKSGRSPVGKAGSSDSKERDADGSIYIDPPIHWMGKSSKNCIDLARLASIVVGIAATDLESRKLLNEDSINTMIEAFPDLKDGELPVEVWGPIAENPDNFPEVPLPVVQSIRVYQRAFPISPAWARNMPLRTQQGQGYVPDYTGELSLPGQVKK
jgi:prepilin-type N-terminal cleavage/methylation domain-containing protein